MNVLETITMHAKTEYNTGMVFAKKNMLSIAQLQLFQHYLNEKGTAIETFLGQVIQELFIDQYKMEGLAFKMPDPSLGYADKIRLLAPEIDYLLKQYKNFVTDGSIDHELLQIDTASLNLSDIPSLLEKKYIHSSHEKIKIIQYHFFDESSLLAHRKDEPVPKTLYQWFNEGLVHISDFEAYQLPTLEQAVEAGDLHIDQGGFVEIGDHVKVIVAGKLRNSLNMSYWHSGPALRLEIDRLIDDGLLTAYSQLYTRAEVSYFNFFLNKKEFSNSMDLRNKYLHGTNNRDTKDQETDYLYFIRTFILLLLKMGDDLLLITYANEKKRNN